MFPTGIYVPTKVLNQKLSHGYFHIGTYIKRERGHLPETKSRADVDRGLDKGADMKTAASLSYDQSRLDRQQKLFGIC